MKSIQRRFKQIEKKQPYWSSYLCFAHAVKEQGFCKDKLSRHFNKLVEKEDYERQDKKVIFAFLISLSKQLRSTENGKKMTKLAIDSKDDDTKMIHGPCI